MGELTGREKFQEFAGKLAENRYLNAISNGLMSLLPVLMVGAISSLLSGLPITPYQNFLKSTGLSFVLGIPSSVTTDCLALYAVFMIAYKLAESFEEDGTIPGVLALMSFLIVTPKASFKDVTGFASTWLGAKGLFSALIIGLVVGKIYVAIIKRGIVIKMPESVPPRISKTFAGLIPGFIIAILFTAVAGLFMLTKYGNVQDFIYGVLQLPLQKLAGNFPSMIVFVIVIHLLWFFGIHGVLVCLGMLMAVLLPLDLQNLAAFQAGHVLPNQVGLAFLLNYTLIGGSGATLGLCILMMLKSKSKQLNIIGKMAFVPGICGINEPILFGVPLILNFRTLIPFLGAPLINITVGYLATVIGLVPAMNGANLPLGTPIVMQGLLEGSWRIALLQIVLVFVDAAIYFPFFRRLDKEKALEEESAETA